MFAGIASFARINYDSYQIHERKSSDMFGYYHSGIFSRGTEAKFKILNYLISHMKKLGIKMDDIHKSRGLSTAPGASINFWLYKPQGAYDKAPTKQKKDSNQNRQSLSRFR